MSHQTKQQARKIGVAGSFSNQMMGNNSTEPKVGEGATVLLYSDRHCYEVVSVSEDGNTAVLEALQAVANTDFKNGEGHQNWILNPTGHCSTVTWRKNAWYWVHTEVVFTKEFEDKMIAQGVIFIGQHLRRNEPELCDKIYGDNPMPSRVVEGITRAKKAYSKVSIIFGVKDYHYDWSF